MYYMDLLKEEKLQKVVKWAKMKGYTKIKAKIEDFTTPVGYQKKSEDDLYVPDSTGLKFGRKDYFEVALKTEDNKRNIRKWKLLDTLAEMKNGQLFLFAPRGHKSFVERIVKNRSLNAKVVSI